MKKFVSLCAFLLTLACPTMMAKTPAAPAHASQPRLTDAEIEHNIHAKLAKSKIGKDGFQVKVRGGVATWEGSTNVMQHKGSATRMAKTAGATGVINNIKISDAARRGAAANLSGGAPKRAVVKKAD